jgi:hypothetical protein
MRTVIATLRRVAPLLLGLAVAACTTTVLPSPGGSIRPAGAPSRTPVPDESSPTPERTLPPTSEPESNPAIGPIWEAMPASWPTLPGQSESEVGTDASSMLVVKGQPVARAGQLRTALEARGWTVDIGSPLEDGSVVVDATHAPVGCRLEAQFHPDQPGSNDGGLVVYYGAACPFD